MNLAFAPWLIGVALVATFILGFASAALLAAGKHDRLRNGDHMILTLALAASAAFTVGAVPVDKDGNVITTDNTLTDLKLDVEGATDGFGTVTQNPDGSWTFSSGTVGATGEVHATATLDGTAHEASAVITRSADPADDFELKFTPVAPAPDPGT